MSKGWKSKRDRVADQRYPTECPRFNPGMAHLEGNAAFKKGADWEHRRNKSLVKAAENVLSSIDPDTHGDELSALECALEKAKGEL